NALDLGAGYRRQFQQLLPMFPVCSVTDLPGCSDQAPDGTERTARPRGVAARTISPMLVIPAPSYSLAQAAWIPRITIWRDDGTTHHREGEPRESGAAAMAASWRLASRTSLRRVRNE